MAQKVYVVTRTRARETWFQLSEEEQKSRIENGKKTLDDVGGKSLVRCGTYSSEWRGFRVSVFPDMDAYHKYQMAMGPQGMNSQRYIDFDVTLGFERPV